MSTAGSWDLEYDVIIAGYDSENLVEGVERWNRFCEEGLDRQQRRMLHRRPDRWA